MPRWAAGGACNAAAMLVRDVMSRDPVTIAPDAPLRAAAELMRERRVRHLPVVGPEGRLLGVLTDRDLRHMAFRPALAELLPSTPALARPARVRDAMTWAAITVGPDLPLARAGLVMIERRIGSLPVVEDGRLVGILTDHDLLRALPPAGQRAAELAGFLW